MIDLLAEAGALDKLGNSRLIEGVSREVREAGSGRPLSYEVGTVVQIIVPGAMAPESLPGEYAGLRRLVQLRNEIGWCIGSIQAERTRVAREIVKARRAQGGGSVYGVPKLSESARFGM